MSISLDLDPSTLEEYQITAFYLLVDPQARISAEVLKSWKEQLDTLKSLYPELCGTFILAPDGVNVNAAGSSEAVDHLERWATEHILTQFREQIVGGCTSLGTVYFKRSRFDQVPFLRWKVQIRQETITSGVMGDAPLAMAQSTHLTPSEWNDKLERFADLQSAETQPGDRRPLVLDTRNDYEYALGTFRGAVNPNTRNFTEFVDYISKLEIDQETEILAFCTGGIRCEKAVPYLKSLGYKNVYQLEGGILGYLESYPNGYFEGDCFVFDQRVAVDGTLEPSRRYSRCQTCGQPYPTEAACCIVQTSS
jgi:UPF0176 protein